MITILIVVFMIMIVTIRKALTNRLAWCGLAGLPTFGDLVRAKQDKTIIEAITILIVILMITIVTIRISVTNRLAWRDSAGLPAFGDLEYMHK